MKNKTIKKLKKQARKIAKDPHVREYLRKQKNLAKKTLKKTVRDLENKINKILK